MCNTRICCACLCSFILVSCVSPFIHVFPNIYNSHFRDPKFEVDSVTINAFDISNNSSSSLNHITTTTAIPHCNITFSDIKASIFYNVKENILNAEIKPFFHLNLNENITVHTKCIISSEDMDSSASWIFFNVIVRGTAIRNPWTKYEENKLMTVSCGEIKVGFSSNITTGTMLGGSRTCHVLLLNPTEEVTLTVNKINNKKKYAISIQISLI
ncbi:hypothetical protein ACOSQ3_003937 [Xanthoceras sorbifolium]